MGAADLSRLGWDSPVSKVVPNGIGGIKGSFEETISQKNEQVICTQRGGNCVIIFRSQSGIPGEKAVQSECGRVSPDDKTAGHSAVRKPGMDTPFTLGRNMIVCFYKR
jgi:hypothetical protein